MYSLVRFLEKKGVEIQRRIDEVDKAARAANAAANDAIDTARNAQETAKAATKKADDTASKLEDLENKMNDANAIEAQREAQLETQREQQREQQRELLDSNLSVTANNAISELDRLETEDQRLMNANKNYEEEKKAKMLHHANEMNKLEEYHKREIAIIEANKDVIKRIGEQKTTIYNLIKLLTPYYSKPKFTALVDDLMELNEIYEQVESTYTYVKPSVDVENKITTVNSTTVVNITDDQLKAISDKTEM